MTDRCLMDADSDENPVSRDVVNPPKQLPNVSTCRSFDVASNSLPAAFEDCAAAMDIPCTVSTMLDPSSPIQIINPARQDDALGDLAEAGWTCGQRQSCSFDALEQHLLCTG